MNYVLYNREERDICAHLFRLLLEDQPQWGPLTEFMGVASVTNPRLFCEAALIRDAYFARKPNTDDFVASVCQLIASQQRITDYTSFTELPAEVRDPKKTHPKQILFKLRESLNQVLPSDQTVYGNLQAMCNAKPDLVICEGSSLYVYEAKYTLGFDPAQLDRTRQIAEVWSKLLYTDLGFDTEPAVHVRTLGLARYNPDVSWETVHAIAAAHWPADDFSLQVFAKVLTP